MEVVDLIIKNAHIITMDQSRRIIPNGMLVVDKDLILDVDDMDTLKGKYDGRKIIDADGKYVFPGLINTHTHLFQGLLKGLGRDKKLFDWLDSSVRVALREIGYEEVYLAAMVGCMESIRSGVTTTLDYQYAHAKEYGLDNVVIDAFLETGIRGILGRAHTDVSQFPNKCPIEETEDEFFVEAEALLKKYENHPIIKVCLAPGIVWDLSSEGHVQCQKLAEKYKTLITMHTLETHDDNQYTQTKFGMDTVPYLEKVGVLGPNFLAVHCVKMTEHDISLFKEYQVKVSHNPISNMILASGAAPVPRLLKEGINISLATDGSASNDTQDMIEVLKATSLLHKCFTEDPTVMSAPQVLEMATLGGAKALNQEHMIGSIEKMKKADFWIMNPYTAKCVPLSNPISALIYHSSQANVETVIINGKVVLENGIFTNLDEEDLLYKFQKCAFNLRNRVGLHECS